MRRAAFLLLFIFPFVLITKAQLQPVGTWQQYLPYQNAIDVTASDNKIFCATPYALFTVDVTAGEVTRYSKVSGLSETGVSTIQYNADEKKLIVAYTNSNIDVLSETGITNIPALKRAAIAGDKSIYHIYPSGNLCYLSTGLGIVVLDLDKNEAKDSWFIGSNGNYVKTNMFTRDNLFYYAATDEGLKRTGVTINNPADFKNWETVSGNNGLGKGACKGVISVDDKIFVLQNDTLFVQQGNIFKTLLADEWTITGINATQNKIALCQQKGSESRVVFLNSDGSINKIIQQPGVISMPKKAIAHSSGYWVADLLGALSQWTDAGFEQYRLNSPENIVTGDMLVRNNTLYAAAGTVNEAWNYQYNASGLFTYSNGVWQAFNMFQYPQLDSMLDFITLAIDPRDESIWAGSYGGGLLHIKDKRDFKIFKQATPIGQAIGDPGSYRVSGLQFDANNNLWIANYGAPQYLHVLKSDGSWQSFTSPFLLGENAVSQILIDDADQKWIISPKGIGVIVFKHGNTIENIADDKWKLYRSGAGNGNLPNNNVLSIAKDKNGFIWVGTSDGVGVIQCPELAISTGCEAYLPVTKDGAFANYLLKGEEVRSIAVDGADRKWMATKNGVWLVNAEGEKVLAHFTENNSPLLDNDVKRIAINGTTGEVYFATAKGICTYRGTAIEATDNNNSLLVFPNPVPPNYSGTIAIKGLAENSFVKITELNGRLVYQAKALGGQAVWNGHDYTGKKIKTGIYLVLVTDDQRKEKAAGKIVFINQ